MKIEQIYTGCLSHGAYYIESNGEAAIIDPLRDVQPYIDMAKKRNVSIKYIFETHFHADFVSGHIDLAKKTGATIVFGPTSMQMGFSATVANDGQEFELGKAKLRVIHTPGHTMESSCFLLMNEEGHEEAIFTGDTLFIGDVGRPDLAQKVIKELTQDKLASLLYDSLRNKIMPLSNHLIIYPAHGAGSACGKNMSKLTFDTLGNQKRTNYALRADMTREEFIKEVLSGLTPPPVYFPQNVLMNIKGYTSIDKVMEQGVKALDIATFETLSKEEDIIIIDTRDAGTFAKGFIPNSINIGIDGNFAVWVGTLIPDVKQRILIVADKGREEEAITRLARVGYDFCVGYLKGGFNAWKTAEKNIDSIKSVTAVEFVNEALNNTVNILDVRKKSEYESEHIISAENAPLDYINESMLLVNKEKPYYVHCLGGYRSMIFISILRTRGYMNLINVRGGLIEIKALKKLPISEYVSPTTML